MSLDDRRGRERARKRLIARGPVVCPEVVAGAWPSCPLRGPQIGGIAKLVDRLADFLPLRVVSRIRPADLADVAPRSGDAEPVSKVLYVAECSRCNWPHPALQDVNAKRHPSFRRRRRIWNVRGVEVERRDRRGALEKH